MKFSIVLALVAAATVVSAETNAERLARGLSPHAPAKRGSPVLRARHSTPSSTPGNCNTGSLQCCSSSGSSGSGGEVDTLLGLVGATNVSPGTHCGMNCSPVSAVGVGGSASCTQQSMCCEGNSYNGIINIGCVPINIVL